VVSSDTPEWSKDGNGWTVTVNGTVYLASLQPDLYGREEYYVRSADGGSLMDRGGDWRSLDSALAAIVKLEAGK